MANEFTAIIEQDGPWFIAYSPEIPGANGQGKSKEEALESLAEAIKLILEDLDRLRAYKDYSFEQIAGDFIKEAVIERLLEKMITRAIDVNRHIISELVEQTIFHEQSCVSRS